MPESTRSTDHPEVVVFPPLLFVSCQVTGLLLHWRWPLPTFIPEQPRVVLAALALVAAAVFGIGGERALHGAGTNVSPHRPTTAIVSSGIYRFTRNPLYLALLCVYTALALWADTLWPFALWVVLLPVLVTGIVAREERYLERKFGQPYRDYKTRAPRWLLLTLLVLGAAPPVLAQAPVASASGPSMTFVGVGAGVTSSDADGRVEVTAFPERSLAALRFEAGVALAPRVALGLAVVPFPEIDGSHNIARLAVSDLQREQAWVGELRLRAAAMTSLALDVVAGAGVLRQQRKGEFLCGQSCGAANIAEPSRTSAVFAAGIDLPLRLGPHLSLSAVARVYWMRRGRLDVDTWPRDNTTEGAAFLTLRLTP